MASSSNSSSSSSSSSSFLYVNIKNYVPINLSYSNYLNWKSLIIQALKSFKLDGHVTGESVCPSPYMTSNPDYSFWIQKESTVISWVHYTVSPIIREEIHNILESILGIDFPIEQLSARQIWLAIELLFVRGAPRQLEPKYKLLRDSSRPIEHPVSDSDSADWSQLPKDILYSIAERLEICFDFTHFRAVCSSWRSSVPPQPCLLPARFPLTPYCQSIKSFFLYKCIFVLVRFPTKPGQWVRDHKLVKIVQGEGKGMYLLHPLWNTEANDSGLLDFMNCQVTELSRQYVVYYEACNNHLEQYGYEEGEHTRKVAFMWSSTEENYYVLLVDHWDRNFAMFSSRDKQWTILENSPQSCEDIISFNGKFYVIDKEGRTMVVQPSSNVSFLADVDSGTEKQFLLELDGQLLLVRMFLSVNLGMNMAEKQKCFRSPEEMVWFKVYKLNEAGQEWEHVKHLGDHVLFLGNKNAFSASASIFSLCERNSIIFSSAILHWTGAPSMFVFNYEDGSVKQIFLMSSPCFGIE